MGLREFKKQRTRQLIADTALRLFVERGFERVTVAEVAEAAGVSEKTVFNYFPTKEDLFFDEVEERETALVAAVRDHGPLHTLARRGDRPGARLRGARRQRRREPPRRRPLAVLRHGPQARARGAARPRRRPAPTRGSRAGVRAARARPRRPRHVARRALRLNARSVLQRERPSVHSATAVIRTSTTVATASTPCSATMGTGKC